MASKVEICNLALSHLAIGKEIANFETEKSEEANSCRRFYSIALETTLRDFPWSFTTNIAALALIKESPNDEWGYSYRYPSDCLNIRRILSGVRNDTRQSRVPYKIAQDASGLIIYTDQADAEIEYTVRAENPLFYPPDFVMAFSFYLAFLIAPRVSGGDQFKLGDRALKLYLIEIGKAVSRNVNEQQAEEDPDSEFIRERS